MKTTRNTTRTFLLALAAMLCVGLGSCFKSPDSIATPIPDAPAPTPKPFSVKLDSLKIEIIDNDDSDAEPHYHYTLASNSSGDSSYIVVDTAGAIPRLTMFLRLIPINTSQADIAVRMVTVKTDSLEIKGNENFLMNAGQIVFLVRKNDKKPAEYQRVAVLQTKMGSYTKEDAFSDIFPWKVTAKNELRMYFHAQTKYKVQLLSGDVLNPRARIGGEFRITY